MKRKPGKERSGHTKEGIEAAKAVIARWDSKDWKAPPTAEVMNRLRAALSAKPEPCCGEYSTCLRACTPRGRWLQFQSTANPAKAVVLSVDDAQALDSLLTKFRVGYLLAHGFDEHNKLRIAIEQARGKV
jgi:hypothetical protein